MFIMAEMRGQPRAGLVSRAAGETEAAGHEVTAGASPEARLNQISST